MDTLSSFLEQRVGGRRGWKRALALRLGVSPSTVSSWINGDGKPDLESSLKIARETSEDPIKIFRLCGAEGHESLYKSFLPEYRKPEPPKIEDVYANRSEAARVHRLIHEILETNPHLSELLISVSIAVVRHATDRKSLEKLTKEYLPEYDTKLLRFKDRGPQQKGGGEARKRPGRKRARS